MFEVLVKKEKMVSSSNFETQLFSFAVSTRVSCFQSHAVVKAEKIAN